MTQHPNAFTALGDALTVINTTADAMALLTPTMMQTIGMLPSDLATTLGGAISSLALVRSALATAKNKTNGRNINHTEDEIGKKFGEVIMGNEPKDNDKEIEDMLNDDDEKEDEEKKSHNK